jgi:hypothetical protein
VTVEEVASLAKGLGWSYETLMSMSGAERRLWLAAARRVADTPASATAAPQLPAGPRVMTDAERKARLLQLHEELNHRGRAER